VELTTSPTNSAGYLLAFRGNVRVLYVPEE
jgi:hypothetical protein